MKLKRHFFVSEDLAALERFEKELESADIITPQIHVLTLDDTNAAHHHNLNAVTSLMKTNLVQSTLFGALVGACVAILVVLIAHFFGWTETGAGWLPFIFLALVALGFFAWEGGLWGIQNPNVHFKEFKRALREGKHVFFVDLETGRGEIVRKMVRNHPDIHPAGVSFGAPHWIVTWQHRLKHFFTQTFP